MLIGIRGHTPYFKTVSVFLVFKQACAPPIPAFMNHLNAAHNMAAVGPGLGVDGVHKGGHWPALDYTPMAFDGSLVATYTAIVNELGMD